MSAALPDARARRLPAMGAAPLGAPTVAEQLESIWQAFELDAMQLPGLLDISWREFYAWRSGERVPAPAMRNRILALSDVVDQLKAAGVRRAGSLLQVKEFDGRSLLDLLKDGEWDSSHLARLIDENRIAAAAHKRLQEAIADHPPNSEWRSYISIPGSIEPDEEGG